MKWMGTDGILGLCKMRWKNFGETTTEEGHKVFFSGKEDKHEHGIGFLVHDDIVNTVMGCRPVSSRLITIRLRAVPFNITIVQAHAPTSDYDDNKFDLKKLKDPNMLETFQALAPLTIMSNVDTDKDSMITTFNTAVTETASEILGKHCRKKKPWITAEILDLCDKRRELRKHRLEPKGSEKYKEVNNNIKRCMKKAKENWIGEQCSETEENLGKNNSKRATNL